MASSKMMASTSAANPDLPRQTSIQPLSVSGAGVDRRRSGGLMNMDELFKNMYDGAPFPVPSAAVPGGGGSSGMSVSRQSSLSMPIAGEAWNGFPTGQEQEMTLEEFLAKAGAVAEEDVRIPPVMPTPGLAFNGDPMVNSVQFRVPPHMQPTQTVSGGFGVDPMGFADGIDGRIVPLAVAASGSGGGVGRGKRRGEEPPMDRATQQKQRRMIKNRESAARSRERKQAYTIELESMVTQLEEENAMLLKEEVELTKERYKQLMEKVIPVVEKRKPPRPLRRVNSM